MAVQLHLLIMPTHCLLPASCSLQFIAEPDGSLVQLGEGAHGVVYLALMQEAYVAVKVRHRAWCREPDQLAAQFSRPRL